MKLLHIKKLVLVALLATIFVIHAPCFAQAQTLYQAPEWYAPISVPFNNAMAGGLETFRVNNDRYGRHPCGVTADGRAWLQVTAGKPAEQMPVVSVADGLQPYVQGSYVYLQLTVQVSNQVDSLHEETRGFRLALRNEDGSTGRTLVSLWNNRGGLNVIAGDGVNTQGASIVTDPFSGEVLTRNVLAWSNLNDVAPMSETLSLEFVVPETGVWGLHIQGHNGDAPDTWARIYVKTTTAIFQQRALIADHPDRVQLFTVAQIRDRLLNGRLLNSFRIYDPEIGRLIGPTDPQWRSWINRITGMYPKTFRELYGWVVYAQFCAGLSGQPEPYHTQIGNSGCVDTIILRSLVVGAMKPGWALVGYQTTTGQLAERLYMAKPYIFEDYNNRVDMCYLSLTSKFF